MILAEGGATSPGSLADGQVSFTINWKRLASVDPYRATGFKCPLSLLTRANLPYVIWTCLEKLPGKIKVLSSFRRGTIAFLGKVHFSASYFSVLPGQGVKELRPSVRI